MNKKKKKMFHAKLQIDVNAVTLSKKNVKPVVKTI